ncbi:hypothetical protein [Chryseolinea sp. H1M3-3]|uniref:hypothetical protein n=1 Tax=Chryseolinea sp. H1M3-3 TaxID=3034144 RepID=UPI0023EDAAE9|nr:hypothetical protein [Chryseolinea sp. H1M3-3]
MHIVFFTILICLLSLSANAQTVEIESSKDTESFAEEKQDVETFSRGFIDYGFEGQLQATAELIKINIGEINKLYLPIYLLVGATNGEIGTNEINKQAVLNLISPIGGVLNVSTNLYVNLIRSESKITFIKLAAFGAAKGITGRDINTGDSKFIPSFMFDGGLFLQTGAWLANEDYKEGGVAWLQVRYMASIMSQSDLETFFGEDAEIPQGPRIEAGILIKDKVNIKFSVFIPNSGSGIPTLDSNQFRLALDYKVAK